jgi:hypothetical protein
VGLGCALVLACVLGNAQTAPQAKSKKTASKPAAASKKTGSKPAGTKTHSASSSKTTRHASKRASSHKGQKSKKSKTSPRARRTKGQQKIDSERTRQIQEALIREHYMSGEPTGVWDQTTQKTMERYQAENGWQSKNVPDSRALIKLGLGPNQDHLLNPESAMTTSVSISANPQRTSPAASSLVAPSSGAVGQPQN